MRIFVTAGNTQVPIDRVRSITNIFTGRTGAAIALEAHRRGHHVTLATSQPNTIEYGYLDAHSLKCLPYRTFDDLEALMAHHIADVKQDAVIHCAAVSDYHAAGIFAPGLRYALRRAAANLDRSWSHARPRRRQGQERRAGAMAAARAHAEAGGHDSHRLGFHRGLLVKFKLEVGVSETDLLDDRGTIAAAVNRRLDGR